MGNNISRFNQSFALMGLGNIMAKSMAPFKMKAKAVEQNQGHAMELADEILDDIAKSPDMSPEMAGLLKEREVAKRDKTALIKFGQTLVETNLKVLKSYAANSQSLSIGDVAYLSKLEAETSIFSLNRSTELKDYRSKSSLKGLKNLASKEDKNFAKTISQINENSFYATPIGAVASGIKDFPLTLKGVNALSTHEAYIETDADRRELFSWGIGDGASAVMEAIIANQDKLNFPLPKT